MAAEFTQVSLTEVKQFLKRAFGSFKARESSDNGEIVIDLAITSNVGIRVFTSVGHGREQAAGHGEDAMRVLLWNLHKRRPIKSKKVDGPKEAKAIPIKRTQGWRDTLRKRLGDLLEEYYDREEYWEQRATRPDSAPGDGPSEKQVNYARVLLRQKRLPEPNWSEMTGKEVSQMIDALKKGIPWDSSKNRPLSREEWDTEQGEQEVFDWESRQR